MTLDKNDLNMILDGVSELMDIKFKQELKPINERLCNIEADVSELKSDVTTLKNDVSDIKLTIENKINPALGALADGHMDLTRKFDTMQGDISDLKRGLLQTQLKVK